MLAAFPQTFFQLQPVTGDLMAPGQNVSFRVGTGLEETETGESLSITAGQTGGRLFLRPGACGELQIPSPLPGAFLAICRSNNLAHTLTIPS